MAWLQIPEERLELYDFEFKTASKTHYYSTLLFPRRVRQEVTILYAFVRAADDAVDEADSVAHGLERLAKFREYWAHTLNEGTQGAGRNSGIPDLFLDFKQLFEFRRFNPDWIEALFRSFEWDLGCRRYGNFSELEEYMYGVAVTIGLMLNRIMQVDQAADKYAFPQGYAAQYANILRDIGVDYELGRSYLPLSELERFGLPEKLGPEAPHNYAEEFNRFYSAQVIKFREYIESAKPGYNYFNRRYRAPIKTAADMYTWTLNQLERDPALVFQGALKPAKSQVLRRGLANLVLG